VTKVTSKKCSRREQAPSTNGQNTKQAGALRDATEVFLAVLDAHTLADLIKPQRVLSSLLLE